MVQPTMISGTPGAGDSSEATISSFRLYADSCDVHSIFIEDSSGSVTIDMVRTLVPLWDSFWEWGCGCKWKTK
jgi:hypothetical protein